MKLPLICMVVALFIPFCNSDKYPCTSDIVFALDGSGSVNQPTWELTRKFAEDFALYVTFGLDATRIGLLTFSSHASVKASLIQYVDVKTFCSMVRETPYLEQSTNMSDAIRAARSEIFSTAGDRPEVGNFLVLLTDGRLGLDQASAVEQATLAISSGITVIGIAVNAPNSRESLATLTGSMRYVFTIGSSNSTRGTIEKLAFLVCQTGSVKPIDNMIFKSTEIDKNSPPVQQTTELPHYASTLVGNNTNIPGFNGIATPSPGFNGNGSPKPGIDGTTTPSPRINGNGSPGFDGTAATSHGFNGNGSPGPGLDVMTTPSPGFNGNGSSKPGFNGYGSSKPGIDGTTPNSGINSNGSPRPGLDGMTTPSPGFNGNGSSKPGFNGYGSSKPGIDGTTPNSGINSNGSPRPGLDGMTTPSPGFNGNGSSKPGFNGHGSSKPGIDGTTPNSGINGNGSLGFNGTATTNPSPGFNANGSPKPGVDGTTSPIPGINGNGSHKPGFNGHGSPKPGIDGTTTPSSGINGNGSPGFDGMTTHNPELNGDGSPKPGFDNASQQPGFNENRTPRPEQGTSKSTLGDTSCELDILFVLDGSGSVTQENFRKQLQATKAALKGFNVSPSGVNVALMTFSSEAHLHFSFGDTRHDSLMTIEKRIDKASWINQRTNHGAALELAANGVFSRAGGDRQNVDNVMVLVTDSESNMHDLRRKYIKALKDIGTRIFVIAVAAKDARETRSMASEPIYYHLIQVLDYYEMFDVFQNLNQIVCAVNIPEPIYSLSEYNGTNVAILTSLKKDDPSFRYYLANQLRSYSDELDGITFFASLNGVSPDKISNDALSMAKFLETRTSLPGSTRGLETELRNALILLEMDFNSLRRNVIFAITDLKENDEPNQRKSLQVVIDEAREKRIFVFVVVQGSTERTVFLHHRFSRYFLEYERTPEIIPTLFVTDFAPVVYSCSFENRDGIPELCGMSQDLEDQFDWTLHTGGTPSRHTGPTQAFSGIYYAYIEASAPRKYGDIATLILPDLRDQIGSFICVQFSYHMNGYHTGTLFIHTTRDSGKNRKIFWMLSGNQGKEWFSTQVTVLFISGQLRISAIRGSEFSGDIAVDDIIVRKGPCAMVTP